jgi:DNA repair ATPase RecN
MRGKRGNGSNGDDPVVAAIHELTVEVRTVNSRLESVEQVLRGHGRQLGEVVDRLGRVEDRLDNIRDVAGERYRSLEERVARLEAGQRTSR